jgi:2-desacetyl-2-hydroxyethyl bacteriochlorophyllide A dehydrogenase
MAGPRIVRFAAPRQVDVVTGTREECPAGTVRVRTLYSGISAGTELTAYRGSNVYLNKRWDADRRLFVPGDHSVTYPISGWGYSEVGQVIEVGGEDRRPTEASPAIGDTVYGVWGHRSEAVVPVSDVAAQLVPGDVDPIAGVFVHVGAIALNAVLAADLHVTESVVVSGQGVIGLLATRLAVLSGATVIAVDGIARRRNAAHQFGAAHTVDPRSVADVAAEIRELTGVGADVAIELSGAYPALHEVIRSVQVGGRVVAAGFYQGSASGLDLGEEFHHNRVSVVASQIGGLPTAVSNRWDRARLHRAVLRLVTTGGLDVASLVTHVVPAHEAQAAYRLLDEEPAEALQVVLDFRDPAADSVPT